MGVKVVRPTYLDKNTGKRCKLDYYVQVCARGERYLRRVGTRDEAYAKKKEIEDSLKDGTHKMPDPEPAPASEKMTFRKYAEKWMAVHRGEQSHVEYSTLLRGHAQAYPGRHPVSRVR